MTELTPETIQRMVRDTNFDSPACFNDLCCHVKALAAEVERLRVERDDAHREIKVLQFKLSARTQELYDVYKDIQKAIR